VNGAIRAKEVRVVAPDGEQIGVKKLNEALWLAEQLDLDLVEVAPNAKPPVCRLMDYGRYKYEQSVKQREARKKQTRTTIKELRMRVRIGEHDFDITRRKTQEFLEDSDKVKVTIRFRGRERERPEFGRELMTRLAEEVADFIQNNAIVPRLAAVLVGEDPASGIDVRNKQKACERVGLDSKLHRLSAEATAD